MKKYQKILIIILVVIVGIVVLKDMLIKSTITTVGSSVVGAPIKIRKFALRAITQKVHIKDLVVYNPKGFPEGPLVDIPEVRVDFDLGALLGGKLHIPLIIFDLKELILVKDKDGNLNVDALKVAQVEEEQKKETEPKKSGKMMPMQIDELRLNVGRVVIKDYSQGEKPVITAHEIALKDKVFRNIKSPEQLAALVMVQAMGPAGVKGAAIYGAATVLGAAFLPAGVVGVLVGKDSSTAAYAADYDALYDAGLNIINETGELKSEDRAKGLIKAKVDGSDITVKLKKLSGQKVEVIISARKMMLPKPEVAGGIQYQISEKL